MDRLAAIKMIFEELGLEFNEKILASWKREDYLVFRRGRSGKLYAWYVDDNDREVCVDVKALEVVDKNTIKKELC